MSLILHGDSLQYYVCWITLSCVFLCKKAVYGAVQRIILEGAAASTSPSSKIFHEKEFDSSSFQSISANSFLSAPQPVDDFPIMNRTLQCRRGAFMRHILLSFIQLTDIQVEYKLKQNHSSSHITQLSLWSIYTSLGLDILPDSTFSTGERNHNL